MRTYAILGATGSTGGSILQLLLENQASTNSIILHVYCRAREKLLRQFPSISSRPDVQIFEGSIDDIGLMAACLAGTDVVFSCVAENENIPDLRIARYTSMAIITALKQNQNSSPFRAPHVVVLSAAPVNPVQTAKMPAMVRWLVTRAFSHVYADLRVAEQMYRNENGWLPATFVQAPGLTPGPIQGHQIHHCESSETPAFLSYLDLAAAMIEVADRGPDETYDWVAVASVSKKGLKPDLRILLPVQFKGLLAHYYPRLWQNLRARRWI
ncbi:averufin oxidase [Talaromyces pinophilus]|uniref:Averufin oxidase n=1 Tax=Talaromyces pinophilus TaxID=128442 RepID=A0A6V8HBN3_TALPI|nr:averufin oxidase [Talaromyces pinophilus]